MDTIRKRFNLSIAAAATIVTEKFELDKTVKSILGIVITSDREDLLFYRGSQKIEINGREIFPDDYESKLLMMSLNVPADNRFYTLKQIAPGNGIIQLIYTDTNHPKVAFAPYRVSLYIECEV